MAVIVLRNIQWVTLLFALYPILALTMKRPGAHLSPEIDQILACVFVFFLQHQKEISEIPAGLLHSNDCNRFWYFKEHRILLGGCRFSNDEASLQQLWISDEVLS